MNIQKNNKIHYFAKYLHHQIRIYGQEDFYSYKIEIKEKGEKWFNFFWGGIKARKKIEQVKELGYIVLKGTITESDIEKDILRNIYKKIR